MTVPIGAYINDVKPLINDMAMLSFPMGLGSLFWVVWCIIEAQFIQGRLGGYATMCNSKELSMSSFDKCINEQAIGDKNGHQVMKAIYRLKIDPEGRWIWIQ